MNLIIEKNKLPTLSCILITLIIITLFYGCGPTIYQNPEFASIRDKHEDLAILPFNVSIAKRRLKTREMIDTLKKMEQDEAYFIQSKIYTYFSKRVRKGKYTIDIQNIDTTNSILSKTGITYENIGDYSPSELAEILDVDVVLSGKVHRSKPTPTFLAFLEVITLFPNNTEVTNEVEVDAAIHSKADGKLIWNYHHTYSGGLFSTAEGVTKKLLKDISERFPYSKE